VILMRFCFSSFLSTYGSAFLFHHEGKIHIYLYNAVVIYDLFTRLILEHMVFERLGIFFFVHIRDSTKLFLSFLNLVNVTLNHKCVAKRSLLHVGSSPTDQ
jgi:hypothetical protein